MRIALAQINPTVGDLRGNAQKIIDYAHQATKEGAELVVFPELCVTGYPPLDLLDNAGFVHAAARTVEMIAHSVPRGIGIIVGAPVPRTAPAGKRLSNAALLLEDGHVVARVSKTLLPTYDVFDEYRYFEPAAERRLVAWRGLRIALHVCEDMWNSLEQANYHSYTHDPIQELGDQGPDLFINISASPFSAGKHEERTRIIGSICRRYRVPFLFANQVGANTEIIFDGDSRVHGPDGQIVEGAPSFSESILTWDTSETTAADDVPRNQVADLHDALKLGIRDYYDKTGFFNKALIGLSGGIDSAVVCSLAVNAIGPDRVVGITMPSRISSAGSVTDSVALANNLGIEFHEIPIAPAVDAFDEMLSDAFEGTTPGVAEENIQARARGVTLMAYSNKFGHLLLSTGNKSEMAVGYSTLYGDMNGGLAVLSDVFKTQVYELARYMNESAGRELIPRNTITKAPSAELRPGQVDQDTLPPYAVLDRVLRLYIEELQEVDDIVAKTGIDRDLVLDILRRVDQNEYKRRQAPPGLRVSPKAFGIGRRLPIVMRWERASNLDSSRPAPILSTASR